MKKIIKFSKFFLPAAIISVLIIVSGVITLCTKGINFGIDFKPGLIEEVRIAPVAVELTYKGAATVAVETSAQGVDFVISGLGAENETVKFGYVNYPTTGELVNAMNEVEGITAVLKAASDVKAEGFFGDSSVSTKLSSVPYRLFYVPENPEIVSVDEIRDLFADFAGASVKQSGAVADNVFQIRAGDDGSDAEISKNLQNSIVQKFHDKFGAENVAVVKTDFVASQFSKTLASKSILLGIVTLLLIWVYAAIRFRWDMALAAIVALVHDTLIMITFIAWTQMEFSSTTLAAVLTIIGYSINDTVVIFDRVRENISTVKTSKFTEILNISLSESLSRTIITTATTMLAVIALYVFTSGFMKDFALALFVGLCAGTYSSLFISSGLVALLRKNWKPSDMDKKTQTVAVEDLEA